MRRGYRDSPSYGDGQLRWEPHFVSRDLQNSRSGAPAGYRPLEERPSRRPFAIPSFPSELYPAPRIIVVSNRTSHGRNPRLPEPPHGLIPSFNGPERVHVPPESDESKLTKEEQEIVLKKLKKQVYNPMPRILARRVSLYYRDLNMDPNAKATEKQRDEDGKSCAVCLEAFEPREEVMLTPCSHMFHEECIVPWVKDQGQCPVCRAEFYERRVNSSTSNVNRQAVAQPADRRVLFSDDLLSLIQAVDEAFPWRM